MAIEKDDFEILLQDKRHKELVSSLKKISDAIPVSDNTEIINAVNRVSDLLAKIAAMPTQIDNKETAVIISKLAETISKELSQIKNMLGKPAPKVTWVHKITKRNYDGFADEITSTPKI